MSNKMLIDASHPEETRVAVVRGNRIEEFDFESQEKKQLRGNIYLAKVTRVEPSLQAAFVDYGGNRHGFLAFSEIHPDYYQIPVADRQALLEAEAEDARASREAEEAEDNVVEVASSTDDDEDEAPKKKPRRRRSRKSKAAEETDSDADNNSESEDKNDDTPQDTEADASPIAETSEPEVEAEAEEKPKRRSTRRKKAPIVAKPEVTEENTEVSSESSDEAVEAKPEPEPKPKRRTTRRKKAPVEDTSSEEASNTDDDDDNPTTMAAMVEVDSISEPLPDDADEPEDDSETANDEPVAEEKPKRRATRKKAAPKKKAEPEASESESAEKEEITSEETSEEEAPKPKKRAPRRNSRKKKETAGEEETAEASDATQDNTETDGELDTESDDAIESVGQEDALEEVPTPPRRQRRHYKIQEVIKRRQVLLVQVVKEERGNKGAALTTYLSLAGRYSVLMPNTARGGGISRKITNAADRKRLKAVATSLDVPQGMGVILRTAGASRTNAEIERDFDYLMRLWEQVRNLTLSSSAPCLVYEEGSLIKRSIRDLYDKDTGEVVVAGEQGFQEAKDFMTMLMPNAAKRVKLHRDKQAIFAKFGVETQLDKMVTPQVTLKSGGYLIIDQTEALVAVDVNSGRSTREHSIENTALQTNLEAAEEVARQLRLRDLAGLIVIDFIDMEEKRNNRAVEKKLKESLKNDRARIQVGRISHFGLMEMSRQRMRASVLESTMDVCSLCGGTGHVRSDSAIALHVFRAIEEHVSRHNRYDAVIKTTPSIAIHLLNHKRAALLELENRYGLAILIEGSNEIKGQDFEIQKGELATGEIKSTAVGFQNGTVEADDVSEDEKEPRGKKRGRGRRKHNDDENQAQSEDTISENGQTSQNDEDSDEDQPRKKRRRGKRGGRRRNGEETNAETAGEDTSEKEQNSGNTENTQVEKKPEEVGETPSVEAEAEETKPKSRSTTRRKAPISKPAEPLEIEAPTENETKEPVQEPEKPKPRRTTRRKKPEETENAEVENTSEASSETPQETVSETSEQKPEDGEKKKKGWWNRGGGFF